MLAWPNFVSMVACSVLCLFFYVKSAGPAALEKRVGKVAYRRCTRYRVLSSAFMALVAANYVVYFFYPLPLGLPRAFPWEWWISVFIAVLIALPSGYIWFRGVKDAGQETMVTGRGRTLFGGIYKKVRHPQALGETPFWWVLALLLNSPFLALYSLIWIPFTYRMLRAEERDLEIRYGREYVEYKRKTGFIIPRKAGKG